MSSDSTLKKIREIRQKISEQCDNDPNKLVDYYMNLQKKDSDRFIKTIQPKQEGRKS